MSCYSSRELYQWRNEGVVLATVAEDPAHDLHPRKVLERPKVIYNDKTGKFVMWFHVDTDDYHLGSAGVAISDSPTGPFQYLGKIKPNGGHSRDMTVFQDDDGKAYLFHSSEWNKTMYISELTDDYLGVSGKYERVFIEKYREAPAVFKHEGRYYIITSGCTGWDPNEAEYAVAEGIFGPWELKGNPCVGPDAEKTFYAQSTFVLSLPDRPGQFIFMADRWNRNDLGDSRYVWLPLELKGSEIIIRWYEQWDLNSIS